MVFAQKRVSCALADNAAVIDSEIVSITVGHVNLPPVLAAIGSQVTDENVTDWFEANYRSLSQAQRTYLAPPQRQAFRRVVRR